MRLIFTLILIQVSFPFFKSFGQQILVTPPVSASNNTYQIDADITAPYPRIFGSSSSGISSSSSASTTPPSWTPSYDDPGTVLLIEFGDGTFTFSSSEMHTYNNPVHKYGVLMKTTGLYDPDTRPPRASINSLFSPLYSTSNPNPSFSVTSYARGTMNPILITPSQKIKVQPNISSLVAGDTMIFILTYKLDSSDIPRKINFKYNNDDFFIPLNGTEEITDGTAKVPFIRYFQNELITYKNGADGYNDKIVIEQLIYDGMEHNIFITLVPRGELRMQDLSQTKDYKGDEVLDERKLTADVQADLVDANSNSVLGTSKNELEVRENSHDPNYVSILPKCLPFPKTTTKELKFHAHCQNIGLGPAMEVRMAIALPTGLTPSYIYDKKVKIPEYVSEVWDLSKPDSVIITFSRSSSISLNGIQSNPMWLNDPNTMGDVWFKIKTKPSVNNVLQTQASIVFTNSDSSDNPAVLTNIDQAAYSACCNCKKASANCGCSKKKSRFWKWLFCKKC